MDYHADSSGSEEGSPMFAEDRIFGEGLATLRVPR